ncbi:hypothetical protein L1O48_02745 [Ligilactobacillus equi]|uniref:hypothetical protein n=1 Tax=Ligilactobacillus equi TaxID=137357 RepID=UPI002ED5BD66
MLSNLLDIDDWLKKHVFVRNMNQTLDQLFPIVLIGAVSALLQQLFFSREAYLRGIFHLKIFPTMYFLQNITDLTLATVALYATVLMAYYTAQNKGAGVVVSMMVFYFLTYQPDEHGVNLAGRAYGMNGLLLGLVCGYFVAQMLNLYGLRKGGGLLFLSAIALNFLAGWLIYNGYVELFFTDVQQRLNNQTNIGGLFIWSQVLLLLTWLGLGHNIVLNYNQFDYQNLHYALQHNGKVRYPVSSYTILNQYANLAGVGAIVALVICVIICSYSKARRQRARLALLPTIFNQTSVAFVALNYFLNPLYLIGGALATSFNILVVYGLLSLNILPVGLYPPLKGAPSLFYAFIANRGAWGILLLVICLLFCDILIYMPFVKVVESREK